MSHFSQLLDSVYEAKAVRITEKSKIKALPMSSKNAKHLAHTNTQTSCSVINPNVLLSQTTQKNMKALLFFFCLYNPRVFNYAFLLYFSI